MNKNHLNIQIADLKHRIDQLSLKQIEFHKEITQLKATLIQLEQQSKQVVEPNIEFESEPVRPIEDFIVETEASTEDIRTSVEPTPIKKPKEKTNFESFIGENLLNKIGILILIIGLGIGVKYSIDQGWVTPKLRIAMAYLAGFALLATAYKLKDKMANFAAVLLSGAMATLYFTTFMAYDFYHFIPLIFTFVLMLMFTVFTVISALKFKKVIIAHLGLVGAYAIPLLLSTGSGKVEILFSYMCLVNLGVIFVSIKNYWESLFTAAFVFTWFIFFAWAFDDLYKKAWLGFSFALVFFLMFHSIKTWQLVSQKKALRAYEVILFTLNGFIFYGIGTYVLNNENLDQYLGLFTALNAFFYFVSAWLIKRYRSDYKRHLIFVIGFSLLFLTLAIPIQLDGHWVTLAWALEALVFLYIARTQQAFQMEKASLLLSILAFGSLIEDLNRPIYGIETLFRNPIFMEGVIVVAIFGALVYLSQRKWKLQQTTWLSLVQNYFWPSACFLLSFMVLMREFGFWIDFHFENTTENELINATKLQDLDDYQMTSLLRRIKHSASTFWIFATLTAILALFHQLVFYVFKSDRLKQLLIYFTLGSFVLTMIALSHLAPNGLLNIYEQDYKMAYFTSSWTFYAVYILIAINLILLWQLKNMPIFRSFLAKKHVLFDLMTHIFVLWMIIQELVRWSTLYNTESWLRLMLTLVVAAYAILLLVVGIKKMKPHYRYLALGLFGISLIKLFLYDLKFLSGLGKTIVFVLLGVLLLLGSFLYNKFKDQLNPSKSEEYED
ncbi:MAG: DUF2339 domain-containing protein [Flavobacteriales bacterium]